MGSIVVNLDKPIINLNGSEMIAVQVPYIKPSFPSGVTAWSSVYLSGTWTTTDIKAFIYVMVGQLNPPNTFNLPVTGMYLTNDYIYLQAKSKSNKSTGDPFTWTDFKITFNYVDPVIAEKFYMKDSGSWKEVIGVYKKISGEWVKQFKLADLISESTKLLRKEIIPFGVNFFDRTINGYEPGGLLNQQNVYSGWAPGCISNYMPIRSEFVFRVKNAANAWQKVFYYDENLTFLSCNRCQLYEEHDFQIGPGTQYETPVEARYVRINSLMATDLIYERIS